MAPSTITPATFLLQTAALAFVPGTVSYSGLVAVFTPSSSLLPSRAYTATLTTGIKDLSGVALATNIVWSFTTGTGSDSTPPTLNAVLPLNAASNVDIVAAVSATFSEVMNPATITAATFSLKQGSAAIPGTVAYAGTTATFTPTSALAYGASYVATISTGAADLAGNALSAAEEWSFTTEAAPQGPEPVDLGTAANFAVLASSGITIGASPAAVTGNIGVSSGSSASLVGFALRPDPSGVFSTSSLIAGMAYADDNAIPTPYNLVRASNDSVVAYNDAAGRGNAVSLGAGELGGRTIAPGLYNWGAAASITTNVTLSGGPNDVWIFQINGALTMAAAAKVMLTGGARAQNIFWQSLGAVGLGASAHLEGIVLSQAAITTGAASTVNGRLLARSTVTIAAASTVTNPAQ